MGETNEVPGTESESLFQTPCSKPKENAELTRMLRAMRNKQKE
jgi:hypothetical protein